MKKNLVRSVSTLALAASALAFVAVGCATHSEPAQPAAAVGGAYPLKTCVVSGEDLGDKPYVFTHNGQTVKLCCKDCLAKFDAEPDKYLAKLNTGK
jgi:hypothetical protein